MPEWILVSVSNYDKSGRLLGYRGLRDLNHELIFTEEVGIDLSFNILGQEGISEICRLLDQSNVVAVNLTYNHFGDTGMIELMRHIKYNQKLNEVCLGNNGCRPSIGWEIGEMLKENKSLQILSLQATTLNAFGLKYLASGLRLSNVTELNLNRIGDIRGKDSFRELTKADNIETIYLENNYLEDWHCRMIGEGFRKLRNLYLSYNEIGSEGLISLIGKPLRILQISNNEIEKRGFLAYGKSLPNNYTLEKLWLTRNLVSSETREEFLKYVKHNVSLKSLLIYELQFGSWIQDIVDERPFWNNKIIKKIGFRSGEVKTFKLVCLRLPINFPIEMENYVLSFLKVNLD